jgi:hypothetical protein
MPARMCRFSLEEKNSVVPATNSANPAARGFANHARAKGASLNSLGTKSRVTKAFRLWFQTKPAEIALFA